MATRRGPDNSVRVAISGTINTATWANVFWCQLTASGTPPLADLTTWLTAFQAAYKTRFAGLSQGNVSYVQAQAQLFLPGGLALPSLVAMTGAGTGANTSGSTQSACSVVSWDTGVYWRGGKPRTYIPFAVAANLADARTFSTSGKNTINSAATGFRGDINALTAGTITGTALGFVSFISGGSPRSTPLFYPFTGNKAHPRVGIQRRRLGKWTP